MIFMFEFFMSISLKWFAQINEWGSTQIGYDQIYSSVIKENFTQKQFSIKCAEKKEGGKDDFNTKGMTSYMFIG